MESLVNQLVTMLNNALDCRDITKYMHGLEVKQTFLPVTRTNEVYYQVQAKAIQEAQEDLMFDYSAFSDAFREVMEQQVTKNQVITIHFSDMEFKDNTYIPENNEEEVLSLAQAKIKELKKCKVMVEYQLVTILETESLDIANRLYYYVKKAAKRCAEVEAERLRNKFLGLEF